MIPTQYARRQSIALVLLLSLLWGSGYSLTKIAVETISPVTVSALRGLGGGLVILAFLGGGVRTLWSTETGAGMFLLQAAFNCIVPWTLVAWAATTIDSGLATILSSLSPIFIFAITWLVTKHEPATPRKALGVVLGLAGIAVIVGVNALTGLGKHTVAELACVAGSLSYAIAGVMGRRFSQVSPMVPAAGATLMTALVLIPIALLTDGLPTGASLRSALALAGLAVFSTGLAFVVYFRLIATIGPLAMSSQAYLRILIGVGIGVLLLGEVLTVSMVFGMTLVVAATIAMTLPPRRAPGGTGPTTS